MRNRDKDLLPEPVPQKQRPFLIAGRAATPLTTGECHEKLLFAIGTADTGTSQMVIIQERLKAGTPYEAEAKLKNPSLTSPHFRNLSIEVRMTGRQ